MNIFVLPAGCSCFYAILGNSIHQLHMAELDLLQGNQIFVWMSIKLTGSNNHMFHSTASNEHVFFSMESCFWKSSWKWGNNPQLITWKNTRGMITKSLELPSFGFTSESLFLMGMCWQQSYFQQISLQWKTFEKYHEIFGISLCHQCNMLNWNKMYLLFAVVSNSRTER